MSHGCTCSDCLAHRQPGKDLTALVTQLRESLVEVCEATQCAQNIVKDVDDDGCGVLYFDLPAGIAHRAKQALAASAEYVR